MHVSEPTANTDRDAQFLREYLAGRDVSCACGYNLRDLQSGLCPECGRALKLHLGSPQSISGWTIIIAGVSGGLFFCGAIITYILYEWFYGFGLGCTLSEAIPLLIGGTVQTIELWIVIAYRQRILTATRRQLTTLAVLAWCIALVTIYFIFRGAS